MAAACLNSPHMANVDLSHSDYPNRRWAEIRVDLNASIADVKTKLYHHVGSSPSAMRLYLFDPSNVDSQVAMINDDWTLSRYSCTDGCIIHIISTEPSSFPSVGERDLLGDASTRYRMTEEDYKKQPESMRRFLASIRIKNAGLQRNGESSANVASTSPSPSSSSSSTEGGKDSRMKSLEEYQADFSLITRCVVNPGDRRGAIAFVGYRPSTRISDASKQKVWIGVRLDESLGNTDGSDDRISCDDGLLRKSVRLFECNGDGYGEWTRPESVEIGDFPPFDPFDVDEI